MMMMIKVSHLGHLAMMNDESFLKQAKMTLCELDLKDLCNDDSFKSITQSEVLAMTQHKMVRQYLWIRFLMKFSKMKHALTFYVLSTMFTEGCHT